MRKKKKNRKLAQGKANTVRENGRQRLAERLLKALPGMLLAAVLTIALAFYVLEESNLFWLDFMMRVFPASGEVVIVEITDDDHKNRFGIKSMPDESTLNETELQRLIEAVADNQPKVIGVDIDTSDEKFKKLAEITRQPENEKIVWVSEPVISENEKGGQEIFGEKKALGGEAPEQNSALPVLSKDNKVTRRYHRFIEVGGDYLPSLPWAVASRISTDKVEKVKQQCGKEKIKQCAKDKKECPKECTDELLIGYAGENSSRDKISASEILDGKLQENRIKDKIVLIGGSYARQDVHDTPVGEMHGVEILANAIEAELNGRMIKPPSLCVLFFLMFLSQISLAVLFYKIPFAKAFLLAFALSLLASLVFSIAEAKAFGSYAQWTYFCVYFVSVSLGLLLNSLTDRLQDIRKEKIKQVYDEFAEVPSNAPLTNPVEKPPKNKR
jgi:CHASE2 domain-containing sensor protein